MPVCCSERTSELQYVRVLKTVVGKQQHKLVLGFIVVFLALLRLNRGFPLAISLHYWHTFAYADVVYRDH